jgi:hypothetical protein
MTPYLGKMGKLVWIRGNEESATVGYISLGACGQGPSMIPYMSAGRWSRLQSPASMGGIACHSPPWVAL